MSTPPPDDFVDNGKDWNSNPPRKVSEKFRAGDADVTFISSDNVLFYIHRKNLETHAAAFPPAEFDTRGEVVPLTEPAETLELLFQYIYPQRHPNLADTPFETLAPLAEAAEKYEVFSAMNITYIRMKNVLPDHATEIFNYASKHSYPDILSAAAPFLLDIPLDEIVTALSLELVIPWVRYWECWSRVASKSVNSLPEPWFMNGEPQQVYCRNCRTYVAASFHYARSWVNLGEKRSRIALKELYMQITSSCTHVTKESLYARLEEELKTVPEFDTFL